MESRIRVLFLIIALIGLSGCAATKNLFGIGPEEAPPPSTEPPGQVISDPSYRRYPPLPVHSCPGFDAARDD